MTNRPSSSALLMEFPQLWRKFDCPVHSRNAEVGNWSGGEWFMTPIEKSRVLAEARETLGVEKSAGCNEIRAAWKRIAFAAHPDRNAGADEGFARAKSAYELLKGQTDAAGNGDDAAAREAAFTRGSASPVITRPKVAPRVTSLSPEDQAACYALLESLPDSNSNRPGDVNARGLVLVKAGDAATAVPTDHVPEAVSRLGRQLTFIVATPLAKGGNRIAVPSNMLAGKRALAPTVITLDATNEGAQEIELSEEDSRRRFPGARSVRLCFGGSAEMATAEAERQPDPHVDAALGA